MGEKLVYHFHDVSIGLETQSGQLCRLIEDYTYLTRGKETFEKTIMFSFLEGKGKESRSVIPADARLEMDLPVEILQRIRFQCYSRGDAEVWYIYEGYGSIYLNYESGEIFAKWGNESGALEITGFILLFIQPLNKMLGRYGYIRLHAACIEVNKRNVLITGLSGRGKSTAAFALLNRGHRVLSDEMPLIKKEEDGSFRALALLNMIKLRKPALDQFFEGFEQIRFQAREDCYIKLSDLNKVQVKELEGIHQVFILEQTRGAETTVEPVSFLEVVPEISPVTLNIPLNKQAEKAFHVTMELLNTVDCYKVYFGTGMARFVDEVEKAQ